MHDAHRTEGEDEHGAVAERAAPAPEPAAAATQPAEQVLMLQRTAGNRAVTDLLGAQGPHGRILARQDQPEGGPPVSTPPPLSDVHQRFLSDLGIDPAGLPPEIVPRLERALDRTRRAHEALRGNVSRDLGGSEVNASSVVTDTSAEMSVTVTDAEASITIRRYYDYVTGRLVQSFTYEDVDARALHATLETEGPHSLLSRVPIVLREEGEGPIGPPPPPLGDEEIDTFEDAVTEAPAGSEEGVASFFAGAIAGDFAENDSFSAIAGQTVVGLIPIAGQIADVRDLTAAIRGVAEGREGAVLNVGIAAIGFIPGLDFLKGGSRVGRRALREAAEESIDRAARSGLRRASRVLTREAAQQASQRLRQLAAARIEMMERLRRVSLDPARHPELRGVADDTARALRNHYRPSDLSGALRDALGIPVRRAGSGASFDHLQEVNTAVNSMRRSREQALRELNRLDRGSPQFREMSELADGLAEMIRKTDEFLNLR